MNRYVLAMVCTAVLAGRAVADTVHNNTATALGTFHPLVAAGNSSGPERGNTITLAGTDRSPRSMLAMFRIGGTGVATFNAALRLYANDGPAGAPGTRLWEGAPRSCIIDSGANVGCSFTMPAGVLLPNTITWTVQISNRSGSNQAVLGPAHYSPPTIGSAIAGVWEHSAGAWTVIAPNEAPLGVRLVAAACPADFNGAGVSVQDIFDFLAAWFGGDARADFNGVDGTTVQDIFGFLSAWFEQCP